MKHALLVVLTALPLVAQEQIGQEQKPAAPAKPAQVGYTDTPFLPGSKWRVHDATRPQPTVVTPGTAATATAPATPPSDAIALFDGTDLKAWTGRGGEARWKVEGGAMEVNGTGDIETREHFGDCQLHVEWAAPAQVKGESQGRGNSGIYFMGRYEVQVLDSHENPTYPDGQAAALYGQMPPLVNASRKPGEWQTYDIVFEAPRFEGERVVRPARVTVFHNGVLVQHAQEMIGGSTHKTVGKYTPHGSSGPLRLQDHGDKVRYRNLWIRKLDFGGPTAK